MSRTQAVLAVILALVTGYGAGYGTFVFENPFRHRFAAVGKPATPQPEVSFVHPITSAENKARQLRNAGKPEEAQTTLEEQLALYPSAPEGRTAKELLGEINTQLFLAAKSQYGKVAYTVQRGDTLVRIARQLKSDPAMIMRTNDLASSVIRPGEVLLVPDGTFSITIDIPSDVVVVKRSNHFFKRYPIQNARLPASSQLRLSAKVNGVSFWKDGARQAQGREGRADATPWILLSLQGYTLYGADDDAAGMAQEPDSAAAGSVADAPAHGIGMIKGDIEELLQLINRGAPVTIIRETKMIARH